MTPEETRVALEKATKEARQTIREVHEARKDLITEKKEAIKIITSFRDGIELIITQTVGEQLQDVSNKLVEFIKEAEARIFKRFDIVTDELFGPGRRRNKPSIPQVAEAVAIMDAFMEEHKKDE